VKGNLTIILVLVAASIGWFYFGPSITGLLLDIGGVSFLLWMEVRGETIMFRHNVTKMDQGRGWEEIKKRCSSWQLIPLWLFKKFASTNLMSANEPPMTESIPERFWALILLIVGFVLQAIGTWLSRPPGVSN
jgi:hypothetical protein